MRVLLYSGLLYLLGIGILLAIKPSFMFTSDGGWKEFGLGRNPEKYTVFPFWMFTLVWAIVSFFMIQLLGTLGVLPGVEWTRIESPETTVQTNRGKRNAVPELKPGYYALNTEGTTTEGVPKYIYIGSAPSEN